MPMHGAMSSVSGIGIGRFAAGPSPWPRGVARHPGILRPMVTVGYHTDPACPWSWAAEPAIRKLMAEFGERPQMAPA